MSVLSPDMSHSGLRVWGPNQSGRLRYQTRRLMCGHLPLPVILRVNLQCADAKTLPARHLDVAVGCEHRRFSVEPDLQVAEGERLIPGRALGDGRDVFIFRLKLASCVRVLKIGGEEALQSGRVLFDRSPRPALGSLA